MTRVDFSLLDRHVPDGKMRFACRLAQKVYRMGNTAFLLVADGNEAEKLDALLWTFDQGSFVPHHRVPADEPDMRSPILIGHEEPGNPAQNVLISLTDQAFDCLDGYARIADLVDDLDAEKATARQRYRSYRGRGYQLETHNVHP